MRSLSVRFELLSWACAVLLWSGENGWATSWLEQWETAEIGIYVPATTEDTFIHADKGYWYVGDTVSSDPNCGATPQRAAIIEYSIINKALALVSSDSESMCADNIWVDFSDWGNLNSGFSIPITSATTISFDEEGELFNPNPSKGYNGLCFIPPCFDSIHVELTDNLGNAVIYILQRHPDAQPDTRNPYYGELYTEVFLDPAAGRYTRNVYNDFSTLSQFNPNGARIVSVVFEVDEHGWGIIDNLFIRDTGAAPPPPPSPGPVNLDWIGIASSEDFRAGVPESDTPWSFHIWATLVNRGDATHIDLFKPHASAPFGTIHWDGSEMWEWGSDSSYSSLANLQVDYPPGIYTLEFRSTSDELLSSVSLDYNDLPAEPTQPVHFTYPSTDHQTNLSTSPTFSWTVSPAAGDCLMLGLHDTSGEGGDRIDAPASMSANSWHVGPLLGNHEYGVWVSVCRVKDWVGPDWPTMSVGTDVFKYTLGIGYLNQLDFFTGAPSYVPHDWNGDGIVSIIGDVPGFVDCVYFQNCPQGWSQEKLLEVGDCNHDGFLSIIGDVPCFVDCVYFQKGCPE